MNDQAPGNQGPATDRFNAPVEDPTKNVSNQLEAAVQRLDDLRKVEIKHAKSARKDIRQELRREMELRARHYSELRKLEAQRIDAIRAVDQGQITRAAEAQAATAAVLATALTASADQVRTQVATTAAAAQTALTTALAPMQKDISDLRQAQYQQQGERAQQTDARTDPILLAIRELQAANTTALAASDTQRQAKSDRQVSTSTIIAGIVAFVAFNAFLISAAGLLFVMLTRKP